MAIGYVSLFREYAVDIKHKDFVRDNLASGWEGKSYNGITVMNFTSEPILVAYRNGLVIKMDPRHPLYHRPSNKWDTKQKPIEGIYLQEEFKLSNGEKDRIQAEEKHRDPADKPIGIRLLETKDCVENIVELEGGRYHPHNIVHYSGLRVITPDILAQMPDVFYDHESDIAICTDLRLLDRFNHPFSSRGQALRLMDGDRRRTHHTQLNDRFTFCIEIVDNSGDIGERWLRPFATDAVYHIPATRNEALPEGIRIFLSPQKNLLTRKHVLPTAKTMPIELFEKEFPQFKLFKKYQDAKHYDDQTELKECRIKLKRLEQDKLESEAAHVNSMMRLDVEKRLIEDKLILIEEQARSRQTEFDETTRRREELHQREIRLKDEEYERLRRQNDELHQQKKLHKQEEHHQSQEHSKEKSVQEYKAARRKIGLDFFKSFPTLVSNVLAIGKLLINLLAI